MSLHLYEQFCLPTDAAKLPADFLTMLSILKDVKVMNKQDRQRLLLDAIKQKASQYITVSLSDKMRSRWRRRKGLTVRRGQFSSRLQNMNRFLAGEKRLLKELQKSVRHMLSDDI